MLQIFSTIVIYFAIKFFNFDISNFYVPFLKDTFFDIGFLYFFIALFIILGSTNATNLTDGLDGSIYAINICFLIFAVFAYIIGNINFSDYLLLNYISGSGEIVIFCTAAIGALLGFLWFNSSPAEVSMGDTGSQSLEPH